MRKLTSYRLSLLAYIIDLSRAVAVLSYLYVPPPSYVKFKRKDKVVTLASVTSSVKVAGENVATDPLTLFQRVYIAKQTDQQLAEYLLFRKSLFSEDGMRKGTMPTLCAAITPLQNDVTLERTMFVEDLFYTMLSGGNYSIVALLWPQSLSCV